MHTNHVTVCGGLDTLPAGAAEAPLNARHIQVVDNLSGGQRPWASPVQLAEEYCDGRQCHTSTYADILRVPTIHYALLPGLHRWRLKDRQPVCLFSAPTIIPRRCRWTGRGVCQAFRTSSVI